MFDTGFSIPANHAVNVGRPAASITPVYPFYSVLLRICPRENEK